jgi:L-fucose mutarotase
MLKSIPPILGPDLLYILRAMGHGDEIAIVDANYPGDSAGPELVRLDGLSATDVLDAVLTPMR